MDEQTLIKLLQIQFEHERKLREFAGKINLNYLGIDLLSVVLDAIGVPADNTIEQIGKYGYGEWVEQPDTFSRDWYYREFQNLVKQGSYEEYQAYLEAVTAAHQPGYFFDLRTVELEKSLVDA
jgi:hypothetical protein